MSKLDDLNIVDLRLRLDGSSESKDLLVVTEMSVGELVSEAERVMEEAEREGFENNEMVFFHEHAEYLEDKLDIEIVEPEKTEAICPNLELEELEGDNSE